MPAEDTSLTAVNLVMCWHDIIQVWPTSAQIVVNIHVVLLNEGNFALR